MAVYFVTGKLGAGKSLVAVSRIQDYLLDGRKVATNLDLNMEHLLGAQNRSSVVRLPDKPRLADMEMLGRGHDLDRPDDRRNGLIVLDEVLDFLGSRDWRDKERGPLLSWFRHARKHRWDIIFLLQDIESADGQLIRQLCEHFVICRRLDRAKLMRISLPRLHIASVHYGQSITAPYVERWVYRGTELYEAYDTEQCFDDQTEYLEIDGQGSDVDMRAPYSYLSAWHIEGRYAQEKVSGPGLVEWVRKVPGALAWGCYLLPYYLKHGRPRYA